MSKADDVEEFHRAFELADFEDSWRDRMLFRIGTMNEELSELSHAAYDGDAEGALDALVDLAYFVIGTAIENGWEFDEAWARVHAANMAKLGPDGKPIKRVDGRVIKPPGWMPPDLSDLV